MWPLSSSKPLAEYEASDEIDEIYHDIRQTLRVTGINLVFRVLTTYPGALPTLWEALTPVVSSRAFETASDTVRAKAVDVATALGRPGGSESATLGPSQAYQVQKALALYHYINPKLLVMVSALRQALEHQSASSDGIGINRPANAVPRGEPSGMYPMEMVSDEPDDGEVAAVFNEITEQYSLSSINSDYRTLALWPEYLRAAWNGLKRESGTAAYGEAVRVLQEEGRTQARSLPVAVSLSQGDFEHRLSDPPAVRAKISDFERMLPPLILNITLLSLDWQPAEALRQSPFSIGGA